MDKTNNIPTLTTIGIDRQTSKLTDKLCKRYSLKKGEIVRLAFVYIDKACINPSEAPESVKSELAKIKYANTMKNGSVSEQIELQEQELKEPKQDFTGENKKEVFQSGEKENNVPCNIDSKRNENHSFNQGDNKSGDSLLSIFSLGDGSNYDATLAEELQAQKRKKKKKKGIRR